MSEAKKCDRCGALYIPYNFSNIGDAWRYSVIKCCHPYPDTTLDLCNNCLFDLEKWVEKGGAEDEVNKPQAIRKCNKCGYFLYCYEEDGKLKFDNYCPNCGEKT